MLAVTFADRPVKVLKFGGSSVGDMDGLKRVLGIIRAEQEACRTVVVVSATSRTTDDLATLAGAPPSEWAARIGALRERHAALATDLLAETARVAYGRLLDERLDELAATLAITDPGRDDAVLATGERMSAPLLALGLERLGVSARAVDAADLVRTDDRFGSAAVDRRGTRRAVRAWFSTIPVGTVPIVTGFIGRSGCGRTTVLGRGGSDYTAAILAAAIEATKLDRWTDVDGLYTADPRKNRGAGRFMYLLLEDATTWSETSRLGMHPQAFDPVRRAGIPVHVRSTRHPQGDGTLILPSRLASRVRSDSRRAMKHAARVSSRRKTRRDP